MQIIDNFLPSHQFKQLSDTMMGTYFPWFYSDGITEKHHSRRWQAFHMFYWDNEYPGNKVSSSQFFPIVEPLVNLLDITTLRRIKANMRMRTFLKDTSDYHLDYKDPAPGQKTAVYYLTTNNGYTQFKNGKRVKSIANRIVIFDSTLFHRGVSCTDEKRRIVINFNWV